MEGRLVESRERRQEELQMGRWKMEDWKKQRETKHHKHENAQLKSSVSTTELEVLPVPVVVVSFSSSKRSTL